MSKRNAPNKPPPVCFRCKKAIESGTSYLNALGKTWHQNHFLCAGCKTDLTQIKGGYREQGGKPYCKACHVANFLPKCAGCNQPIEDTFIKAVGQVWHKEHITCCVCNSPALTHTQKGLTWHEKDGKIFCKEHYVNKFCPTCVACGEKIADSTFVKTNGKYFHRSHFQCTNCKSTLQTGKVYFKDKHVYCKKCYGSLFCRKCCYCFSPTIDGTITTYHSQAVCAEHKHNMMGITCFDCGIVIPNTDTNDAIHYDDPRVQCIDCFNCRVMDVPTAGGFFQHVKAEIDSLYSLGVTTLVSCIRVLCWDKIHKVATKRGSSHSVCAGVTNAKVTISQHPDIPDKKTMRQELKYIGILQGMTEEHANSVLAHELMHAYMFVNKFNTKAIPITVQEGMCELLSYLWMTGARNQNKNIHKYRIYNMTNGTDAVYSEGFQQAVAAFDMLVQQDTQGDKKAALHKLLQHVRKFKTFPKDTTALQARNSPSPAFSASSSSPSSSPPPTRNTKLQNLKQLPQRKPTSSP
eukprot:TRINITY_DN74750_c0_g1_i1.p1 TRINITY_DN74750_c0_g1~~TRINITY_DN74750_c0_g1_i1.p1  ORF type:complete len:519 (-),score=25.36 TRINITY_DN74750_c0_g1_i1:76-1632(-)